MTFTQESAVLLFETIISSLFLNLGPKLFQSYADLVCQDKQVGPRIRCGRYRKKRRQREMRAICDLMNNEILKDYRLHRCLSCPQKARKYDNTNELLPLYPLSHQYTTPAYFANTYTCMYRIHFRRHLRVIYHYILSSQ